MTRHDIFDGFTVNVFLDEDGDYLAHFVEMPNISAFSDTPEGALKELAVAWEGVKESYRNHNEPIPKCLQADINLYVIASAGLPNLAAEAPSLLPLDFHIQRRGF